MTTLAFFRNPSIEEPDFFDEGPAVRISSGSWFNTSSIDTSTIAVHRQGVEITQQKHYDAGIVKIHAGDPGHVLKQTGFGMTTTVNRQQDFKDNDRFNPVVYVTAQASTTANPLTLPIITDDKSKDENFVYDGVLESLTIRSRASFRSVDKPYEAHEVKGALMSGNEDRESSFSSDTATTVYTHDLRQISKFHDRYENELLITVNKIISDNTTLTGSTGFNSTLVSGTHTANLVNKYRYEKALISPYDDKRYSRNITTASISQYGDDMLAAMSSLSCSVGYLRTVLNDRSATCGWDYDRNVNIGTDSLAFGGMVY